jgi:hypothetical protein
VRRTLVIAVAGALALSGGGVATASSHGGTNVQHVRPVQRSDANAVPRTAASGGHARAEAEAKTIIKSAPVLAGSKRRRIAPDRILKRAPESEGVVGLVTLSRYWTIGESAGKALHALTAKTPAGFRKEDSGSGSGPGFTDSFVSDSLKHLPAGIADGELLIAVSPLKHGTGIGVYAEAAPQPPRPAKENVPTSVSSVGISWTLSSSDAHPLVRTISGREATALVTTYNSLKVATWQAVACPANFGEFQTATFVADGHTWVATVGNCGDVQVVRDGQGLKTLALDPAFYRQIQRAIGLAGARRPATEKVARAVHTVHLRRTGGAATKTATVNGNLARTLVESFNALAPIHGVVFNCTATTGPTTTLTFGDSAHTWVASEDPCGLLTVTRDGTALPTVVAQGPWDQFVQQALHRRAG